ncbi:MAG TPA: DUF423 domain-containing protein [Kofleriaceae bacterium]|jgi:uncharacterized membrane protein YgdD (TMEM256/DUF423 family)
MTEPRLVAAGAINGALAVVAGTVAAHGLRGQIGANALAAFETGARYHMFHALAMVLAGIIGARASGWIFQLGIVLFCGSLYALALTDVHAIGFVTPFGGVAFLVGWICLAVYALKRRG